MMDWKFYRNVLLKALILFLVFNFILVLIPAGRSQEQISLYNHLLPGRLRFPFGENPKEAYNLSLYDLDAMFASHVVADKLKEEDYRIFIFGDSSVWGTLLTDEQTLIGQLNGMDLTCGEKTITFYNLGYPTISVLKDLMIMQRSHKYKPDMVIWLTTLEAFPMEKQLASPLAANNLHRIEPLVEEFNLPVSINQAKQDWWSRTLFGRRRALADWFRLQMYGVMWAATGIDQIYPEYTPAATDLQDTVDFYDQVPPDLEEGAQLWTAVPAARELFSNTPFLLVNEPMLISDGENSEFRYNYFYPRWAYDQYREKLIDITSLQEIQYIDAWDWIPSEEFTNSAIHLTPAGEAYFAKGLAPLIVSNFCHGSR